MSSVSSTNSINSAKEPRSPFYDLPPLCLKFIISFANPEDTVRLRTVSRMFRDIVDQNDVWRAYLTDDAISSLKGLKDESGNPIPISERVVEIVTMKGEQVPIVKKWGGYQQYYIDDIRRRERYMGQEAELKYIDDRLMRLTGHSNTYLPLLIVGNYIRYQDIIDHNGGLIKGWRLTWLNKELFDSMTKLTFKDKLTWKDWPIIMELMDTELETEISEMGNDYIYIDFIKIQCLKDYVRRKEAVAKREDDMNRSIESSRCDSRIDWFSFMMGLDN